MADRQYGHVLSFALDHAWALTDSMMSVIASILAQHIAGLPIDQAALDAALVNRRNLPQPRAGSVAIIPVHGVIAPRMNMMSEQSGGTTFEKLTAHTRTAVSDKTIKTIVLDIDSPGSNVAGATEYARELLRARTKKPIIAQIQYTGASGAYWVASCCTEIVASPSAQIGSIGIVAAHTDLSEALAKIGIKKTYLSAGEGKTDGNDAEPLSAAARARSEKMIGEAYAHFVGDVVKGRGAGMTAARVRDEWKAHVYGSAEALSLGMIDGIATLDDTIARVLSASPDAEDQRAALNFTSSTTGTDQERPSLAATSQDQQSRLDLERSLFELQL